MTYARLCPDGRTARVVKMLGGELDGKWIVFASKEIVALGSEPGSATTFRTSEEAMRATDEWVSRGCP